MQKMDVSKLRAGLIAMEEVEQDMKSFKKLLRDMKDRLITAMEDEEDIAESLKALEELKSGKVQGIPWKQVKAKYGL